MLNHHHPIIIILGSLVNMKETWYVDLVTLTSELCNFILAVVTKLKDSWRSQWVNYSKQLVIYWRRYKTAIAITDQ